MKNPEILKHLLRSYAERNDNEFRRAALQLAANESRRGYSRIAEELREIIQFSIRDGF